MTQTRAPGSRLPGGTPGGPSGDRSVAVVTLGCARNETDSEELAGRLESAGWRVTTDAADASVVLVNTCGFIEQAKAESIETVLDAADLRDEAGGRTRRVVATGCLAERYGSDLAESLTEADAVLGFDDYGAISDRLDEVLSGTRPAVHRPRDRRTLLPISPAARHAVPDHERRDAWVGPPSGPAPHRKRLGSAPVAPLKLASGCDRRCAFCAIPSFRGAFTSRAPDEVLREARWLAEHGVRELLLVSENTTSYGKDLADIRLLERLLPQLAAVSGVSRVRLSYLQPAEMRPSLIEAVATTPGVVPYFDLSFQHASAPVLRRMRRFGSTASFLQLLTDIREASPTAGVRTNVIVGFPGESERDLAELERFLSLARLDAVGVFGYSDEDGTEAAGLPGKLPAEVVGERVDRVATLVEDLMSQRARERIGETVSFFVDEVADDGSATGRADHQGPDSDGSTTLRPMADRELRPGDTLDAIVVDTDGVDLVAEPVGVGDGGVPR